MYAMWDKTNNRWLEYENGMANDDEYERNTINLYKAKTKQLEKDRLSLEKDFDIILEIRPVELIHKRSD